MESPTAALLPWARRFHTASAVLAPLVAILIASLTLTVLGFVGLGLGLAMSALYLVGARCLRERRQRWLYITCDLTLVAGKLVGLLCVISAVAAWLATRSETLTLLFGIPAGILGSYLCISAGALVFMLPDVLHSPRGQDFVDEDPRTEPPRGIRTLCRCYALSAPLGVATCAVPGVALTVLAIEPMKHTHQIFGWMLGFTMMAHSGLGYVLLTLAAVVGALWAVGHGQVASYLDSGQYWGASLAAGSAAALKVLIGLFTGFLVVASLSLRGSFWEAGKPVVVLGLLPVFSLLATAALDAAAYFRAVSLAPPR